MPNVETAPSRALPRPAFTLSPTATRLAAAALLVLMGILMFASFRQESQTFDEPDHLYSGFEYWHHTDFGHNPEHPPLVKLLATLPLLSMHLHEPVPSKAPYFKQTDFLNAAQFLYSANPSADAILLRGRLVMTLITLVLGVLIFLAASEMFSPLAGLIALFLFAFEPVFLGNGPLVTTDVPLTCLFFAATYTFYRYCKQPSTVRLGLCAAATGLTLVSKQSGILIFPVLLLLAVADLYLRRSAARADVPSDTILPADSGAKRHILRLPLALVCIGLVSYAILWTFYCFRYAARPGDLRIVPSLASYSAELTPLKHFLITFAARHHLFPEAYLYGWTDILLIPGTRPFFLFGHLSANGRWFFFPAMILIKSTITLLLFVVLVPFARIRHHRREFLFLLLPAAFYFFVSVGSMLNLGVRHILPIYPFCIVLAGAAASAFALRSRVGSIAVAAALLFAAASSLHAFPDYLAYVNELVGGPSHAYEVVTGSDAGWQQGYKWAHTYMVQHPTTQCWFDNYDPVIDPAYFGIPCKPLPSSFGIMVGRIPAHIPATLNGTVLISTTDLAGTRWGPGTLNPYASLRDRKPDAVIGDIILVYHGAYLPVVSALSDAATANTLVKQKQIPEALALAQTAAEKAPESATVQFLVGQTLAEAGRTPEAHQAFLTALHLAQSNHPDFQAPLIDHIQQSLAAK